MPGTADVLVINLLDYRYVFCCRLKGTAHCSAVYHCFHSFSCHGMTCEIMCYIDGCCFAELSCMHVTCSHRVITLHTTSTTHSCPTCGSH
jgi:hypothetical protein